MLGAFAIVVPLAVAGAISPVMLTEQALLLAGRDGRRTGTLFAAGAVATLLMLVVLMVSLGRAFRLPTEPRLSQSLDLVVGAVLLAVAGLVFALGQRHRGPATGARVHSKAAGAALPFGIFSMATNVTTLALMVPAAKVVSSANVDLPGRALLVAVVVAIASLPAWAPVALIIATPDAGERVLTAVRRFIVHWGRLVLVVASAAAGLFFIMRGATRLLG